MASIGLLGRKLGMSQWFDDGGRVVPVTVLEVGPCTVLQVKSRDTDGYDAVQLGFLDRSRRRATRPERGHVQKAGAEPKRFVREIRLDEDAATCCAGVGVSCELGAQWTVEALAGKTRVSVIGRTKGRGFQGVMKRHGFHGLKASHGVHRVHRHAGSIGQAADPARVFRGTRMPGHFGCQRCSVRHAAVVRIDGEQNLLLVKGSVPGASGGFVIIRAED